MLNQSYSEAITETLDILSHTDQTYVSKISPKFLFYLRKNASPTYKPNLDHTQKLTDMPLKPKTRTLLTIIYRNYWCTEEQKLALDKKLAENERLHQAEMREKYSPDVFRNKKSAKAPEAHVSSVDGEAMMEYRESVFVRIWKWVRRVMGRG